MTKPRRGRVNICGTRDRYGLSLARRLRRASLAYDLETLIELVHGLPAQARVVDLISHTASDDKLLTIGNELVDSRRRAIVATFERIATALHGRRITSIRLLGCGTAMRPGGRRTLRDLSRILAPVRVYGTIDMLTNHAFDRIGLLTCREQLLISGEDV